MAGQFSEWMNDITLDQLPEPYFTIAHEIGLESTIKLADLYQGTGFYLPRLDKTIQTIRDKRIRAEFNGSNHKELARKYSLTERWIYEIVNAPHIDRNQMSFFHDDS